MTTSEQGGAARDSAPAEASPVPAARISRNVLEHAADIAAACRAKAVFVYADPLGGESLEFPERFDGRVFYVTSRPKEEAPPVGHNGQVLRVPNVPLTRTTQVKMAAFLALSRGLVRQGDTVVFVSGSPTSGTLDTLMVLQVGRELEMFTSSQEGDEPPAPPHVLPEVIERVVDLASELGSEGREGRPVGTMFVIGDTDQVLPLTRQLILNPFRGYPEEARNILDPTLGETVKELATIDGAFLIRGDGIIESCGTYLKTASQEEFELPQGLGARHHAAAAITSVTPSIAVTVSESTGTVSVFRGGRMVTEMERPRASVRAQAVPRSQWADRTPHSGDREGPAAGEDQGADTLQME